MKPITILFISILPKLFIVISINSSNPVNNNQVDNNICNATNQCMHKIVYIQTRVNGDTQSGLGRDEVSSCTVMAWYPIPITRLYIYASMIPDANIIKICKNLNNNSQTTIISIIQFIFHSLAPKPSSKLFQLNFNINFTNNNKHARRIITTI